jgi:hypothetical protein
MKKLFSLLGMTFMLAFTLTGCELYFGKKGGDGGGDDEGRPPGWSCTSDAECAAGCYCDIADGAKEGECAEAGFCSGDEDCPEGYVCDGRSSCVPGDPPQTCTFDVDCPAGAYCNNGLCETSCVCENDAQAQAAGWAYCDEARGTCHPDNAQGTCGGAATCGTEPVCPVGSVALINETGCYTGQCADYTKGACDVTPACPSYQHETDCYSNYGGQTCSGIYNGINCTKPDGSMCQSGDVGCTCTGFVFSECR